MMPGEIITAFYQQGVATTAALISTGLYIRQMIRERSSDSEHASRIKLQDEQYNRVIELLEKTNDFQQLLLDGNKSLMINSISLAELSKDLSKDNHEIMALTNVLVQDLKVLAVNQLNLMNGFQKVIEQLIAALKNS